MKMLKFTGDQRDKNIITRYITPIKLAELGMPSVLVSQSGYNKIPKTGGLDNRN